MIRIGRLPVRAASFITMLLACFPVVAQVSVRTIDAETRATVPFVNLSWTIEGVLRGGATDAEGRATLSIDPAAMEAGVVVHATSLGYEPAIDTLRTAEPFIILLDPARLILEQAVITGQYGPTNTGSTIQRTRSIGAAEIRRMAAENLGDLMRQQLNMGVQQDNVLGTALSMQGLGGENVKVLVDGVPMIGRLNGSIDLSRIDLSGVRRVEVIEGPMSVSYGTNALAGTINLITRPEGDAPTRAQATLHAEHLGRLNLSIGGGTVIGRHDVQLTAGHNFFGGWDPRQNGALYDPSPRLADSTRAQQWKPREQDFLRANWRYRLRNGWSIGLKGEAMRDRIIARGAPRAPYYESAFDERHTTLELNHAVFFDAALGNGRRINAQAAHNRYARSRNTWANDLTTLHETLVASAGSQDTTRFTLSNVRATFTSAGDSAAVRYEVGTDLNLETGSGQRIADGSTERIGDHALFASMEWRRGDRFALRPGVRTAYNTRYGAPVVPSLNLLWRPRPAITVRAAWAQGFRAPSLKELHLYFVDVNHNLQGNADLRAERSQHADLSISGRQSTGAVRVRAELAGFYNHVRDRIALASVDGTLYTYVNIGEVRTIGGSLRTALERGAWSLAAGATITGYEDDLSREAGRPATWSPEAQGSITWQWEQRGFGATLFGKYTGESVSYTANTFGEVGTSTVGSYTMADLLLSKRLCADRLTITAGCKNLADVTNVAAVLAGGVHGGGAVVPMATGRTWILRIDIQLERSGK